MSDKALLGYVSVVVDLNDV